MELGDGVRLVEVAALEAAEVLGLEELTGLAGTGGDLKNVVGARGGDWSGGLAKG